VLLRKAILQSERDYVTRLERQLILLQDLSEGGAISPIQVVGVEQELLRGRIRVLRCDTQYADALDEFRRRHAVTSRQLEQLEEAVLPLSRHLRRFEDCFKDLKPAQVEFERNSEPEHAPKLRGVARRILTASALVKGTRFARVLPGRWAAWEKLPAPGMADRLRRTQDQRHKLWELQIDLRLQGRELGEADQQRLHELELEMDLGPFEQDLRRYEGQPWKGQANSAPMQQQMFWRLSYAFEALLYYAHAERIKQVRESWPALPSVRLEKVDLVTGDWKAVEQATTPLLEKRKKVAAGKKNLRKLRELAHVYRLQQRLIEISYSRYERIFAIICGPVRPDNLRGDAELMRSLTSAAQSLVRARRQLLSMWIQFQMAQLDLEDDLGLPSR
jgi:hypothetical protein